MQNAMTTPSTIQRTALQAAGVLARVLRIPGTLACPGQAR
jgi:hypothetical protein